jgi:hypothetical protein
MEQALGLEASLLSTNLSVKSLLSPALSSRGGEGEARASFPRPSLGLAGGH